MGNKPKDRSTCQHPNRTDLKGGNGFRCDDCGAVVHNQNESGNKTDTVSVSSSPDALPRYTVRKADGQYKGKGVRWTVWNRKEGVNVKVDGVEFFRRKNADRIADENNGLTVKSVPPVSGDAGKDVAKRQRQEFVKKAEDAAQVIAKVCGDINASYSTFRRTASESIKAMETEMEIVRKFWKHKRDHETLLGFKTSDEWSLAIFKCTYDHFCRVLNGLKNSKPLLEKKPPQLGDGSNPPANGTPTPEIPEAQAGEEGAPHPLVPLTALNANDSVYVYDVPTAVETVVQFLDTVVEKLNHVDRGIVLRRLEEDITKRLNRVLPTTKNTVHMVQMSDPSLTYCRTMDAVKDSQKTTDESKVTCDDCITHLVTDQTTNTVNDDVPPIEVKVGVTVDGESVAVG
jgi:hypothetical protein